MKALLATFTLAIASAAAPAVFAQAYPAKPITIVVPFAAGGPTDTLARLLSERLRKTLGQPVIVDNTTGAGGSIATAKVVRAPPDGYMVSIGHWGSHVVNGAYYTLPFHLLNDFAPVAMIATNPQVIVSKNAVPAKSLKELLAWIRVNQDKLLVGTGGVAASSHMGAVYFQSLIGAKFHYVHYRGGAPALQALLGGEVDLYVTQVSTVAARSKPGKSGPTRLRPRPARPPCRTCRPSTKRGCPGFTPPSGTASGFPKARPGTS